jgi:hypothetical protein
MSKKDRFDLIYGLILTVGWIMCGVGYAERMPSILISEILFLGGLILCVVGGILFIANNMHENK